MATNFQALYEFIINSGMEYIVIGGCAATLHGSPRNTLDLDLIYRRTRENMERIAEKFAVLHPYLRGAPAGLPFRLDFSTIRAGLNFTLITDLGELDLLAEVAGGGTYENLLPHTEHKSIFGMELMCVNLDKLIELKRAAGRPKDYEPIAELETIRQERQSGRGDFHP